MAFPEPPTIEDEIVLCHLRECNVNCATGGWRQNDVLERTARRDGQEWIFVRDNGVGFDPATSSAPFVATLVDVTGIVIYFTIASIILRGTLL